MREVRNKVKDRNYPVQEQTEFGEFITAAPGLPVHLCGNGVMPECVNFEITDKGLVPRLPMVRRFSNTLKDPDDPLLENYHLTSYKTYDVRNNYSFDLPMLIDSAGAVWLPEHHFYLYGRPPSERFPGREIQSLKTRPFYGNLNLLVGTLKSDYAYMGINGKISRIFDFPTALSGEIRGLGLPKPEFAFLTQLSIGRRWIGIEHAIKNDSGIVIRSSGIVNALTENGVIQIPNNAETMGITHVLVYISDKYTVAADDEQLGHPTQLYLLSEVPVEDIFRQGTKYDDSADTWTGAEGSKWIVSFGKVSFGNANVLVPRIAIQPGLDAKGTIREPSTFSEFFEFSEEDYNLIPMETGLCFAGNRLWGASGSKAIFAHEAGSPRQEQRMPVAMVECNVANIIDMAELDGHLYIFGEKGVARIDNADATSLFGKPHVISSKSCANAKVNAVPSFGIFAIVDGILMFLDANTLEYSTNVKGMDMNALLGGLVADVDNFELLGGNLYFTTQNRLFKINIIAKKGLTEIRHADGLIPMHLANLNNEDLCVLYKRYAENGFVELSFWAIRHGLLDKNLGVYFPEDISRMQLYAAFAKPTLHGWVEHWDTSVLATLPEGAKVGTETIADGLHYNAWTGIGWDGDRPRNILIPAGKINGLRPIGSAVAVRVSVGMPEVSEMNADTAVHSVKITTLEQKEVFNELFNPNSRAGREFQLVDENGISYEQEGSNYG